MKIKLLILLGLLFGIFSVAHAAPSTTYQNTLLPINSTRDLGSYTRPWRSVYASGTFYGDGSGLTGISGAVNDWGTFGSTYGTQAMSPSSTMGIWLKADSYVSGTLYATTFSGAGTGITGLAASNFTSANISQWTNDSNFLSNSLLNINLFISNGSVTSSLTADSFSIATSTGFDLGRFYIDSSGNASASGSLRVFGQVTSSGHIYPASNNALDLGSYDYAFRDTFTSGTVYADEICFPSGNGCLNGPITEGSAIFLYPWNQGTDIATYEGFRTVPTTTAEIQESCAVASGSNAGYCATPEIYITTTSLSASGELSLTQIPAGTWTLEAYTYVNNIGGNTKLEFTVFKRTALGVETDLFQATTTDINLTAVGLVERQVAQPAFTINPTDRLGMRIQYWTDSVTARTLYWVYQGNSHSSHLMTPITVASRAFASLTENNAFTGLNTFSQVIKPATNNAVDLGGYGNAWKDVFASGTYYGNGAGLYNVTGTIPAGGASAQLLQYLSNGLAKWITLSSDASIADGGAVVVADDSHNHTGTTISGLAAADFTSANISAWTNDAGFISNSLLNSNLFVGNGSVTSSLTANSLVIATSTTDNLGKFYVDSSGNAYASGSVYAAGYYNIDKTPATSTQYAKFNNTIVLTSSTLIADYKGLGATSTIRAGYALAGAQTLIKIYCQGSTAGFVIGDGTASSTYAVCDVDGTTVTPNVAFAAGDPILFSASTSPGFSETSFTWVMRRLIDP